MTLRNAISSTTSNNSNNNKGSTTAATASTTTTTNGASNGYYLSNFSNENYTDGNCASHHQYNHHHHQKTSSVVVQACGNHHHQSTTSAPSSTPNTAINTNPATNNAPNTSKSYRYQAPSSQTTVQHPSAPFATSASNTATANINTTDANMVNYELESASTTQATQAVNQKIANLSSVNFASSTQSSNGNNAGGGGNVLGDISNVSSLTPEERKKLEEIRIKRSKLSYEIEKLKQEISHVKQEMNRLDQTCSEVANSNGLNNGSGASKDSDNSAQRAKQLSIGKKKFNMDSKKGIEFLFANSLLKNTPEEVAKFLHKGDGLNKTSIGTYLGEKIDFNLKVLDAFIELHDFKNLLLVQALRQFLWSFRLPGEAQKIDRMMEKFAARYCQQNPGVFSNTDTCFVLSFAIIMLNTSLHNPNVKEKMTSDRFIVMNRGINNGGDLPKPLLISLYDSIRQEPFRIPEDDGNDLMHTFFNPDREGWLWKQGGRYKGWKRRWFILNDKCLYYFEYTTDKEPRGIIPLENVDIRETGDRGARQNCFELYSSIGEVIKACKTDTEGRVIEGKHSIYRLASATAEEKDAWVAGIRASVSRSPFYEMLAARKRKAQYNK